VFIHGGVRIPYLSHKSQYCSVPFAVHLDVARRMVGYHGFSIYDECIFIFCVIRGIFIFDMEFKMISHKQVLVALLAGSLMSTTAFFSAHAVEVGDTMDAVVSELGTPQGTWRTHDLTTLSYPRGQVALRDGRVVSANLLSIEAFEARKERDAIRRTEREIAQREATAKRIEEGTLIRDNALVDARFQALPGAQRAQWWRQFMENYPEVPIGAEYHTAVSEWRNTEREALARAEEQRRLRELEQRVASAEARASAAERRSRYSVSPIVYWPAAYPVTYTRHSPYPAARGIASQHGLITSRSCSTTTSSPGLSISLRSSGSSF